MGSARYMITPAPPLDKKRKLSTDQEVIAGEKSVAKLAKLDQHKQANPTEVNPRAELTKPSSTGQAKSNPNMGLGDKVISMLSPSKESLPGGKDNEEESPVPEVEMSSKEMSRTLQGIAASLEQLVKGQAQQAQSQGDLEDKMDSGLTEVRAEVQGVADRVKALEESKQNDQVPMVLTKEERHEQDLLAKIEHSKRCVTVLGTRRDTLSIKDTQQLILTSKLAVEDECEILSVSRLGNARTTNPAFKVELKSAAMATSLIENSKVQSAKGETSLRCVMHYPFEYSERAREMKGMQAVAWRAGCHSQIYFEGTELCLKVKERDSKIWMIYPSEFGTYKPQMVMRATSKPDDSEEIKAAREALLSKLNVKENLGKLEPCEKSARSLIFSSRRGNLNDESCAVKLPHLKDKLKADTEVIKPSSEVAGEYQTRLVFKSRDNAKEALQACIQGFKSKPLPKGEFLALELLWAS